ncbi:MAG: cbb3-type cytochrome c oxidase subunit I [Pseudomonadota bacterium]
MSAISIHDDHHHDHPTGIKRWLSTTNHKDLGTLYMSAALIFFFVGGAMALTFRAELFQPGLQFLNPALFNQLVTVHALVMVFAAAMPVATGFNNYLIPLMIGAPDMALPRVNNWGFWILPLSAVLLVSGFILTLFGIGDGAPGGGWTNHNISLSMQGGIGTDMLIVVVHLLGISSVTGAINVIVTVLNMRAPGMTLMKMPLFVWSWLVTSVLVIIVMPVFSAAVTMLLTDRHFGTNFFNAAGGGDPVLWQHVFWFFGHPEVYIVLLPAWGIIPNILATFTNKPVYGYKMQVFGFWGIGILGHIVWAHHMLTSGMPLEAELYFMYATMSISIPTGVLAFCWVGQVWKGAMTFETPMLFALAFVFQFGWGGVTGLIMPDIAVNAQYHNTYVVVPHFHYTFLGGAIFAFMAAGYYYLPKFTGHMYDEKLSKVHFWLSAIGFNMTFIPQFFLGFAGMPRHYADYPLQFADFNMLSSTFAYVYGLSQLIFAYIVIKCVREGRKVSDKVWDDHNPEGLEWTLPSPPPYHTFDHPPVIK